MSTKPDGAPPVVFKLPTLGQPVRLGELYDQRAGQFLGVQLYPQSKIQEAETDIRHTELRLSLSSTHEEKASLLDIKAQLSLEVLGGLVSVSGSAAYLKDSKSNTHEYAYALALKMRLKEKRILFAEDDLGRNVLEVALEDYIGENKPATHFVSAIVYGGNFIVNLVARQSEVSMEEKIEGKLEAKFDKLKGAISLEGSVEAEIKGQFKDMNDKFDLVVHGDVALEKVPVNPQDVLDTFPNAASLIADGGGVPISVTLQPIPPKLYAGSKIYELEADLVNIVLKAFSRLDDFRSRFAVLMDGVKSVKDLVPELTEVTVYVNDKFTKDHSELLGALGKFLLEYQHGKHPDPSRIIPQELLDTGRFIAEGDPENPTVLERAQALFQYHNDPTKTDEHSGQYFSSLTGLEKELSKFRNFVFDVQKERASIEKKSASTGDKDTLVPFYLSNIEDVCRAIRIQNIVPLFITTPLTPKNPNPDITVIQFLAIIRKYVSYFRDPHNRAHILYTEDLGNLEKRLPNHGKFADLKRPTLYIGQVDVEGSLTWREPPPATELALKYYHKPSDKQLGNVLFDIDPINGTESFSFQIQAKAPKAVPPPAVNWAICVTECTSTKTQFLRFQWPLSVKIELEPLEGIPRSAVLASQTAPGVGQSFTVTFVQNVPAKTWYIYLNGKKVNQLPFNTKDVLQDSVKVRLGYPVKDTWWDGEVYGVKAYSYALTEEQVAAKVQTMAEDE